MYLPRRIPTSEFIPVRGLQYHVWRWGDEHSELPPLVLLHGWMDVGASYQFMVDAFSDAFIQGRQIVALDWRGFGLTAPPVPTDHYVFADYLADLDQLMDHIAAQVPVDLVGHSMGGNVAMLYAGVRAARVRRLVNLEGFGLPEATTETAAQHLAHWMDQLRQLERGEISMTTYATLGDVAGRLMKNNPRLPPNKAAWLAQHWSKQALDGRWHIRGDAAHKVASAQMYRVQEMLAIHAAITAPTLAVEVQSDSMQQWWKGHYTLDQYHERLKVVPDCRIAVINHAGHMLHHDQPQAVAGLIEAFCATSASGG